MKHFIITRFHYPDKKQSFVDKRIDLFKRFTCRSLLTQRNKDFVFVMIGSHIDINQSGEIDVIQEPHDYVFDVFKDTHKYLVDIIRQTCDINEVIITSRVDNDDYLLPNYVVNLQTIAIVNQNHIPFAVDQLGYWYDMRTGRMYENNRYSPQQPSPFTSVVSRNNKEIKTCFSAPHASLSRIVPAYQIQLPGWVQILHDTNKKMNRIKSAELNAKYKEVRFIEGFKP